MKLTRFYLIGLIAIFCSCSSSNNEDEQEIENEPIETTDDDAKIVWKNWYLSVPLNRGNGSATSIFYQDIVNDRLTDAEAEYFYKNEDGSYTMFTKFTGFTTSGLSELGGKYCRTELREFWRGNQSTSDNWSMSTGTHILESTLKVDFVEGNGRTIVAQIHGKETAGLEGAPATVKIRWNSGTLQIDYYTKPDAGELWTSAFDDKIDVGVVDNEIFTFKIKIEDGKFYYGLVCEAKSINIDYTLIYDYVGNGYAHENYFKTGNYFGWHDDYEKTAQVVLYEVKTEHF
ncbi:polysaccharide lyase family 7 protein [Algibacter luteus]|uniref:polysaccharide lyase family 7 protein n=1 Tax=Algibacter luteus TaxID=1178825 RepID=UPI002595BFD0|nr:polysaccharide lyase family 7 protein [Algibacter luteus]WJJ95597.1 polysaccharide lyase family 7 protein [Algibacter luteus]